MVFILPTCVNAAFTDTPDGLAPEELIPKDFVSLLDYTLPAKQDGFL